MYYYGIDWTAIIFVLPAIIFAAVCSARVKKVFKKYNNVQNISGLTGYQAARVVLDSNGLQHIQIQQIEGELTDHYDPSAQVIRLSDSVYAVASPAAVGVAAHEAGHAVQHAQNYAPAEFRSSIVKATNIGSKLSMPLIIAGLLLSAVSHFEGMIWLAYIGVALFSLCVIFQLVTLPTEFDASRRALKAIEGCGLLAGSDLDGAKKVLRAAAMTYVAALAVAMMQFLRLLSIVLGGRRRG